MNTNMVSLILGAAGFVCLYGESSTREAAYIRCERSGAQIIAIVRGEIVEVSCSDDGTAFSVRACDLEAIL